MTRKLLPIIFLVLLMFACAKPVVQHPGAVNAVDNALYDTLLIEHAALSQARTDVAKYPAAFGPFNAVIAQYNVTAGAYRVYHSAATAGATPDPTALSAQVTALDAAVKNLLKQIGGTL